MEQKKEVLALSTRKQLYDVILAQPGICIRELERTLGLALGELTYHLPLLLKAHLIREERDEYFRRFFPYEMSQEQIHTLTLLRRDAIKKVIPLLLVRKSLGLEEVSRALGTTRSTSLWHIKRMLANGLLLETQNEGKKTYALRDRERIEYIYKI